MSTTLRSYPARARRISKFTLLLTLLLPLFCSLGLLLLFLFPRFFVLFDALGLGCGFDIGLASRKDGGPFGLTADVYAHLYVSICVDMSIDSIKGGLTMLATALRSLASAPQAPILGRLKIHGCEGRTHVRGIEQRRIKTAYRQNKGVSTISLSG